MPDEIAQKIHEGGTTLIEFERVRDRLGALERAIAVGSVAGSMGAVGGVVPHFQTTYKNFGERASDAARRRLFTSHCAGALASITWIATLTLTRGRFGFSTRLAVDESWSDPTWTDATGSHGSLVLGPIALPDAGVGFELLLHTEAVAPTLADLMITPCVVQVVP